MAIVLDSFTDYKLDEGWLREICLNLRLA